MESNTAAVATTSAATEVDPTYPSGLNQVNPLVSNIVGQGGKVLGSMGGPHFVQVQNKLSFLLYGLPPNYTHPMLHTLPMRMSTTPHLYPLRSNNMVKVPRALISGRTPID